eukprot:6488631-Amphidinium_carterae.1
MERVCSGGAPAFSAAGLEGLRCGLLGAGVLAARISITSAPSPQSAFAVPFREAANFSSASRCLNAARCSDVLANPT